MCVCVYMLCVCVYVMCVCMCCHMYTVVCVMQLCNICEHLEDQMGTQCTYNGPILWGYNACTKDQSYGEMMCTCTEDQSYGTVHAVTHTYVYIQSLK